MEEKSSVRLTIAELERLYEWAKTLPADTISVEVVQGASNGIGSIIKAYSARLNGRGGSWTEISDIGEW